MRRLVLVLAVAGMLVLAGCVDDFSDDEEIAADRPDGELSIHHIDVGQADATLLIAPNGETMLIDTGDFRQDGAAVLSYLDEHDVDRIDHLVATHAHADHIGGHAAIIEEYETERDGIGAAYDSGVAHTSQTYERYLDAVETHDVELFEVAEGDSVPFGEEIETTVLNPTEGDSGTDLHYNSVALTIEFGQTTYLATGDAEEDAETRLVEEWAEQLDADLYHAGHHGSSTSSTEQFMSEVEPEYAVISSGGDSQYGHPHDETLQRFDEHGIETYWTGAHGDVVFRTDGDGFEVTVENDRPTDPAALLELKPIESTDRIGIPTTTTNTAVSYP